MMKKGNSSMQLKQLREVMSSGQQEIHAVIIPSTDAHQTGEPVDAERRVKYISGFTGPSAIAVVTKQSAALWTGKKWHYQAELQLDDNWTLMKEGLTGTPTMESWICSVLSEKSNVSANPGLFRADLWISVDNALQKKGHKLISQCEGLVDKIWKGRPNFVSCTIDMISPSRVEHGCFKKISNVRKEMTKRGADWLVLTALDEVAWLFNLTGSDLPFSPLFFAFAVVGIDSAHLFVEETKLTGPVKKYLDTFNITIHEYSDVWKFLETYCNTGITWLSQTCTYAIMSCIKETTKTIVSSTPVAVLKCCKTQTEINGIKEANNRDAVAFCRFLHWLELNVHVGKITECSAGDKLNEFRKDEVGFVNIGFEMMSCAGANTSILLYCNDPEHDVAVKSDEIYMIDSGAFFRDQGSTDSCRTVHFGTPTLFEKETFTLVLKAHIDLAMAHFPEDTKCYWLSALAKMPLWKKGLDFDTIIGHGIGFFQSIEGPPGILISTEKAVIADAQDKPIVAGMLFTDEPGYYEKGKFGIRTENTLLAVEAITKYQKEEKKFLKFEVLSFIPIQKNMIIKSMLEAEQIEWVNNYHKDCLKVVGDRLKTAGYMETYEWLQKQTTPI